jgi:hypothetical protein
MIACIGQFQTDQLEAGLHHPEQLAQVIPRRIKQSHRD